MKTPAIYCQEKHRQTLKQHPSSFPFQIRFPSSHFTLQSLSSTGETGALQSVHKGSSLPLLRTLLFSLAPAWPLPKGRCSSGICLQCGLLLRLQYLLRHQEASFYPPSSFFSDLCFPLLFVIHFPLLLSLSRIFCLFLK